MKRKGFRSEFERGVALFFIKNKIKYEYEIQYLEYQHKIVINKKKIERINS